MQLLEFDSQAGLVNAVRAGRAALGIGTMKVVNVRVEVKLTVLSPPSQAAA